MELNEIYYKTGVRDKNKYDEKAKRFRERIKSLKNKIKELKS